MAKARKHWPHNHDAPQPEGIASVKLYIHRDKPVRILCYERGTVAAAQILEYKDGQWAWELSHDHTNVPSAGGRKVSKAIFDRAVEKYCIDYLSEDDEIVYGLS
jgi:hypothetical protein